MELTRVDYEVNATHGSDPRDHGLDHAGGLSITTSSTNSGEFQVTILNDESLAA
jgi:hypothetical protein